MCTFHLIRSKGFCFLFLPGPGPFHPHSLSVSAGQAVRSPLPPFRTQRFIFFPFLRPQQRLQNVWNSFYQLRSESKFSVFFLFLFFGNSCPCPHRTSVSFFLLFGTHFADQCDLFSFLSTFFSDSACMPRDPQSITRLLFRCYSCCQ